MDHINVIKWLYSIPNKISYYVIINSIKYTCVRFFDWVNIEKNIEPIKMHKSRIEVVKWLYYIICNAEMFKNDVEKNDILKELNDDVNKILSYYC